MEIVRNICGKKFETEKSKNNHRREHDVLREICNYCGDNFSRKSSFQRHLLEQHNVFQHANNCPMDGTEDDEEFKFKCNICQKEFKYERNVVAHIDAVHYQRDECKCIILLENGT